MTTHAEELDRYRRQTPRSLEMYRKAEKVLPLGGLEQLPHLRAVPDLHPAGPGLAHVGGEGHEFPVELTVAALPSRETTEFSALIRDIRERRRAEEEGARFEAALEKAAAEWRQTFDAIESPVLVLGDGVSARARRALATSPCFAPRSIA